MDVTVKGSSMIRPSQDTPKERQWISNLDMVITTYHVPLLFFYKPNGSSDFFKPQVLTEALSKTLVPFYPMAGRLGLDENGRLEILCNTEGFSPSSKLRKLVPMVDYSGDISSYPLVMAQMTTISCICLGIATHHTLTDGTTALHFINSWSELARGLPQISMPPLIDRTLLRPRVPPIPRFHHLEYDPPPSLNTCMSLGHNNHKPSTVSVFKITQNQLNTLKAKSWEHGKKTNYSTYTILAAYIWRCATKARGLSYDQPTKLYMPTNGRLRLHPPLPSRYVGNAIFTASLIALSGNLQSESFVNTLERVHGTLRRMDNEYPRSALDYLETLSDITAARRAPDTFQCPNLNIINWIRLPTDDGSLSLVACLQTAHIKLFEKHLYEGLMSFDKIKARY
ncbi:hypothetical protein ES319_A05G054500v1 [Gossypium barbadense]|uniref:Uncharacterized protein n=1 Tax=Gossypium barbadense TaxID=3634 RepID=A0A5J5VKN0_GOSBA|nr:hypothetical protein ES319_A05G054500v1 [Gossypium barbadense]